MNYKIVADSSCELNKDIKSAHNIELVPLVLRLEDNIYTDDSSLNLKEYLKDMANCKSAPKSSFPSPDDFKKKYDGSESVFVVTMSSQVSGTYNSATLARDIYKEESEEKFIHIFDSHSASVGETITCLKIAELAKVCMNESEVVEKVNQYIRNLKTFFLLENFDHLVKSGRLNPLLAKIDTMLAIKPIMGADENGNIKLFDKARGYKKAFSRLIEIIGEQGSDLENRVLGIAHCNCFQRALELKEEVLRKYKFKDIFIVEMSGLTSTYADEGGLVIAF